jgi:hypothetical protein
MSDCTWVEKRPQTLWALLREAITCFLNPYAEELQVLPVVIDLVACDQEICLSCPGVRPDALPEIVGNFVIRDGDVCILARDFDPFGLTGGIVQVDLTIDDLVRVDQQRFIVQHVYLPACTQAITAVKQRHVMIVLQGVAADRSVLCKTQEDAIRFDILNQIVCDGYVTRYRGLIVPAPDSKHKGILNQAVLNRDALCGHNGDSNLL